MTKKSNKTTDANDLLRASRVAKDVKRPTTGEDDIPWPTGYEPKAKTEEKPIRKKPQPSSSKKSASQNIKISSDAYRRIKIYCAHEGGTLSDVIDKLITLGFDAINHEGGSDY